MQSPKIARSFGRRSKLPFAFVASLIIGCGAEPPAPAPEGPKLIKMLTLGQGETGPAREFPGQAKATRAADLAFRVAGVLQEFPVVAGQTVETGDVVAKLDQRDFQTALNNASGSLAAAEAQLTSMDTARPEEKARLEANVLAREAELTEVELRHTSFESLLADRAISKLEYDQVKAELDVARQNLEAAKQALEQGMSGARQEDKDAQQARVDSLKADEKGARDALADAELRAPFSGVIARTYVENFEEVQAKESILSIQDISRIEIAVNISESDLARAGEARMSIEELAAQAGGTVRFTAYPGREFPVTVESYETEADPETQTFEVTLIMDQPDDALIQPGMNAVVRATGGAAAGSDSIFVPVDAVIADSAGAKIVWLVDPATQRVKAQSVEADQMSGDRIRITQGLSPGDTIAVSAVQSLAEGMEVAPMPDLGEL